MTTTPALDAAADVLSRVRERRRDEHQAAADLLAAAVAWAGIHSVDERDHHLAAMLPGAEGHLMVAGEGAPLVAEFSVCEFAAAMGITSDAGAAYLGEAVELAHRLRRVYARVQADELPAWKARRIAQQTISLPIDGAEYVDRHVAPVAHKIGIAALDRLIEEALVRFDPDEAKARRLAAADVRRFDIDTHQVSYDGTISVEGVLDLADAIDLDEAVKRGAAHLADLGSDLSLDVRRSIAAGDLARRQLALELNAEGTEETSKKRSKRTMPRQVVLHAHLAAAAITGTGTGETDELFLARIENTRSFIDAEQVKAWCANPDTQVVVKPVIDLTGHIATDAYEVPDRLRERQVLLHHTCVFPWCTRPGRKADCDHVTAASKGGTTCSCNTAPLCRRHHRVKTHGRWTYVALDETTFRWRSPHGLIFIRDHTGTQPADHTDP
ncbi:HNH endonuclease [Nocardioides dongkuii]|uniref:HNH endonuclease n=1 Tax=Nocardioides dongkuii TaxID=2760089 RepID=UPI0015F8004E|nr:HNH endonuclease signature motif containing protein [Nocardioides dongkuii]